MSLRKHISIILSSLVLFANIGLAINVHYCHEEVTAVSFAYKVTKPLEQHADNHKKEEGKSCCGHKSDNHKKCCKNDVVKLQDKTDQAIVKSFQLDLGAFYTVSLWAPAASASTEAPAITKESPSFYCESNAPPLYKLYCQLVLYA